MNPSFRPSDPRCEYLRNPLGIDVPQPRFSTTCLSEDRNKSITACQILVSRDPSCEKGSEWDSKKLKTDSLLHIEYKGKTLSSDTTYFWKICCWDENDKQSNWSEIAYFHTGLLEKDDWKGQWISSEGLLRHEFNLPALPVRAHAFFCGLGYGELHVNGIKAGDHVIDPAFTKHSKRALYVCHDISSLLNEGSNALGVMLAMGYFGEPAALLQLNVECADGSKHEIVTDKNWKTSQSPLLESNLFHGETFDARLDPRGWNQPGFNDKSWKSAKQVPSKVGALSAQLMPPIRKIEEIVPFEIHSPEPNVYIFDMGQNFSGWAKLRVEGPAGTRVVLRFGETLYEDGRLNQETNAGTRSKDTYILRGEGVEEFEPHFTYHGFRYVEVRGFPGVPTLQTLRGCVVHTDVESIGGFTCSNPLLNKIQRLVVWGQKTNLHSIPTDCCNRFERQGWMADALITADTAMKNFDMAAFYSNFLRNIADEQHEDGSIPDTVPRYMVGERPADPLWGAAYPIICWEQYLHHGDLQTLEIHFEGIRKWIQCMQKQTKGHILSSGRYGDWISSVPSDQAFLSTAFYLLQIRIAADMAKVLENKKSVTEYDKLSKEVAEAMNKKFYHAERKMYSTGTQTEHALALLLKLPPTPGETSLIARQLNNNIVWQNNNHTNAGFMGIKYIMEMLSRHGFGTTAYELATQTTYPSWGYMIEQGATTFWEIWQKKTSGGMNSQNHPMLGSIGNWFYTVLAGIQPDPVKAGYKHFRIAPQPLKDLQWASGSIRTVCGLVSSSWSRSHGYFKLETSIPVGSTAEIILPLGPNKNLLRNIRVMESGKQFWGEGKMMGKHSDIRECCEEKTSVVLKVGSGQYSFELYGD